MKKKLLLKNGFNAKNPSIEKNRRMQKEILQQNSFSVSALKSKKNLLKKFNGSSDKLSNFAILAIEPEIPEQLQESNIVKKFASRYENKKKRISIFSIRMHYCQVKFFFMPDCYAKYARSCQNNKNNVQNSIYNVSSFKYAT